MTQRKYSDLFPEEWYQLNPDIDDAMDRMLVETRKKRAYTPRGYREGENKICYPIPELLKGFIQLLIDFRLHNKRSLRETQDLIYKLEVDNGFEDPPIIALGGISQLFDRIERDLGISTKETSRERIRRKQRERIIQAKKEGKSRPYHFSSEVKKKIEVQKRLTQTNRELKELEKEKKRLQQRAARNARRLKLKNDPTKYVEVDKETGEIAYEKPEYPKKSPEIVKPDTSLIETYMDSLKNGVDESKCMEIYREIMEKKEKFQQRDVAFLPTPRQYKFLSAPEDIVLYGGAAG
jgi:hypothetical protein